MLDTKLFFKILNDKNFFNLKKLKYKYGNEIILDFIETLKSTSYKKIFTVEQGKIYWCCHGFRRGNSG